MCKFKSYELENIFYNTHFVTEIKGSYPILTNATNSFSIHYPHVHQVRRPCVSSIENFNRDPTSLKKSQKIKRGVSFFFFKSIMSSLVNF